MRRFRKKELKEAETPKERRHLKMCYVCEKKITGHPVYIAADPKHPEGQHRHNRCEPGSKRWLECKKDSPNYSLFPQIEEEKK